MRRKTISLWAALAIGSPLWAALVIGSPLWAAPLPSPLAPDSHCVAYEAQKVTFFLAKSMVTGTNCEVSAQVLPDLGGLYHVEVNIPLKGFSSGDVARDQDVREVLKEKEKPELTFRSEALTAEQWRELFGKTDFDIKGTLSVGNGTFPLTMHSHYITKDDAAVVDGTAEVRFSDFGLRPPRVAAGIVTKAKPDLKLFFRLQSQRILGADSIRLGGEEK
jgi:polyisoprenoid-binding protein YceI